jgi:glycosyltransferase involved in cell wall biosynthesis
MRTAAIVPVYQAAPKIGAVVTELMRCWPDGAVWVIDDGSRDGTGSIAEAAGATVVRHEHNRGKGAALRTGMRAARAAGFEAAVTVDGDGQHPPSEALRMHRAWPDLDLFVIGVRDLVAAGAPRPNQLSNRFSNLVLSGFTGRSLQDTQCGLRRYPLAATLALDGREHGYGYEAEILIRAIAAGMTVVHEPIEVLYPPPPERLSHFDALRDPARIVVCVLQTVAQTRARQLAGRWSARRRRAREHGE